MSHWIDVTGIRGADEAPYFGTCAYRLLVNTYGAKGFLDPAEAKVISEIEPPVVPRNATYSDRCTGKGTRG